MKVGNKVKVSGSNIHGNLKWDGQIGVIKRLFDIPGCNGVEFPDGTCSIFHSNQLTLMPDTIYKHPDSEEIKFTFGQIRAWARKCSKVEAWMKNHFPEAFEEEEKTYARGQLFKHTPTGEIYILSICGVDRMILICTDGDWWSRPQQVNDSERVTEEEFNRISNHDQFEPIPGELVVAEQ